MPIASLIVRIGADLADLKKNVEESTGIIGRMETGVKAVGAVMAAAFSARQVVAFAQDFVQSFAEQEAAVSRVTTALKTQGTFTPELVQKYADLAAQFQRTTTNADEAISETQALLIQVGNVMPQQMQGALTAVTNLASGLKIDLHGATMLIAKALEGNLGVLKRYGIEVDDVAFKLDPLKAIMDAVQAKFGGQATAELETYTGKTKQLANVVDDVKESFGKLIVEALTPALKFFTDLPQPVQNIIIAIGALGMILAPMAIAIGGVTTAITAMGGAAVIGATLMTALGVLMGPAGLILLGIAAVVVAWKKWDAITAIVQNVYAAVKTWLVDRFQAVVDAIKAKIDAVTGFFRDMYNKVVGQSYIPDMISGIASSTARLDEVLVKPVADATAKAASHFGALGNMAFGSPSANDPYANIGRFSSVPGVGFRPVATGGGGGGGIGVTIQNTFNIVDTEANIVRRVSDAITRQILQGAKVGA